MPATTISNQHPIPYSLKTMYDSCPRDNGSVSLTAAVTATGAMQYTTNNTFAKSTPPTFNGFSFVHQGQEHKNSSSPQDRQHFISETPPQSPGNQEQQSTRNRIMQVTDKAIRLSSETTTPKQITPNITKVIKDSKDLNHFDHPVAIPTQPPQETSANVFQAQSPSPRLNKFVRRLHDMLQSEKDSGIVEWRRGLLVLQSTDAFAKNLLPKYFNTRNFKTFRRQLNYYGFVHVRSFSSTGSTTTALWVNRELAQATNNDDISSVLLLKRVEPCDSAKTAEGRRFRKELAISTVEDDLGVSAKSLQIQQIKSLASQHQHREKRSDVKFMNDLPTVTPPRPVASHELQTASPNPNQTRIPVHTPVPSEIHFPSTTQNNRFRSTTITSLSSCDYELNNEEFNNYQHYQPPHDKRGQATHDIATRIAVSNKDHECESASDESSAACLLLMLSRAQQ